MDQMLVKLLHRGNEEDLKQIITKASAELAKVFVNAANNRLVVIKFQSSLIFSEDEIRDLLRSIYDPVVFTTKICALLKQRDDVLGALNKLLNVDLNDGNLRNYQLKIRRIFIRLLQDKLIKDGSHHTYNKVEFEQLLRVQQIKVELVVDNVPSSSSHINLNKASKNETNLSELPQKLDDRKEKETSVQTNLPEELEKFVCEGKELEVKVVQPTAGQVTEKSQYLLRERKNYAFILNIIEFDKQSKRKGSEKDTNYMNDLLKGLGYKIYPEGKLLFGERWTKEVIDSELESFKGLCIQHDVDSMVVYLGSHGCQGHLVTSDEQWLDIYNDVIYKLQYQLRKADNSLKSVAKIFINQSCQTDLARTPRSPQRPTCEDTVHILAQMPKYKAPRDEYYGSYFVIVLVYVLMTQSWNTPLHKMLQNSQNLLKRMSERTGVDSFQVNPYCIGITDPFYFFPR